jgi:putative transposase
MNVLRTIAFKLRLTKQDGDALLNTMRAYTKASSKSAIWGFENQSWNQVDNHKATYTLIRQSIPDLPSSLVQGGRDCACESLKAVKGKILPERKSLSAMRYNQRVITINLMHGVATIASTKGRIRPRSLFRENTKIILVGPLSPLLSLMIVEIRYSTSMYLLSIMIPRRLLI